MVVSGVIQWSIQGQCVHVGCSVCPSSVKHAHLVQSCLGDLAAVLTVTRICALKTWVQPGFFLKQSSHVTGWVSGQLPIKVVLVMTMWVSRNNNHCVQVSASAHVYTQRHATGIMDPGAAAAPLTNCPPGALPDLPTAKEQRGTAPSLPGRGGAQGQRAARAFFKAPSFG